MDIPRRGPKAMPAKRVIKRAVLAYLANEAQLIYEAGYGWTTDFLVPPLDEDDNVTQERYLAVLAEVCDEVADELGRRVET